MSPTTILLRPRDPIIVRDARPFAAEAGARAFTLPWPLPRTIAGTLRSHVGNTAAPRFRWTGAGADGPERALRIEVHGPLLAAREAGEQDWTIYVPAPRDVVHFTHPSTLADRDLAGRADFLALRPETNSTTSDQPGSGCLWPENGPDLRPLTVANDYKPDADAPEFWSLADVCHWLTTTDRARWRARVDEQRPPRACLPALDRQTRTHVKIERRTGTGEEGRLFSTEALTFNDWPRDEHSPRGVNVSAPGGGDGSGPGPRSQPELALVARLQTTESWDQTPAFVPLGGERRLAVVEPGVVAWPAPSLPSSEQLTGARGIRLQLLTPAIFTDGWRPGWLAAGAPPSLDRDTCSLRLVGAAVGRRVPVSGWDLSQSGNQGARATDFAVPAGSVFFFEVVRGALTPSLFE
ncbi:MAG: hypothetical protein H0W06_00120, partial [Chloroflexia bacterium]|nr:hypothetical protein [Chloroflexia bacterium]